MMTITHIGTDSLSVAMGSLMLVVLFWWRDSPRSVFRAMTLGVVFGLALLTKAYFLAFLPPRTIVLGLLANQKKSIAGKL